MPTHKQPKSNREVKLAAAKAALSQAQKDFPSKLGRAAGVNTNAPAQVTPAQPGAPGELPVMHKGGKVKKTGLALLQKGEVVIPAKKGKSQSSRASGNVGYVPRFTQGANGRIAVSNERHIEDRLAAKTNASAKPASQTDSQVSGSNHGESVVARVRRANGEHRDAKSRLGQGKSASVVVE